MAKEKKPAVKKNKITSILTGISTETKRIRWPKFSELIKNTGEVLVFCILFAIFFVICDLLVGKLLLMIGVGL